MMRFFKVELNNNNNRIKENIREKEKVFLIFSEKNNNQLKRKKIFTLNKA